MDIPMYDRGCIGTVCFARRWVGQREVREEMRGWEHKHDACRWARGAVDGRSCEEMRGWAWGRYETGERMSMLHCGQAGRMQALCGCGIGDCCTSSRWVRA
ncbi:hypothetical protein HPP92_024036 [Vanilla planifolia]|uniref:Uncharacterized protein n=1 Tax=Vanilla planifolia TaxID=51239 RepID=A0A835UCK1_VANPL|nr:hypothetical protein HPP92_024036 [Vanilla planifolia]